MGSPYLLNEFGLCMASYWPSLFAPFYGSRTVQQYSANMLAKVKYTSLERACVYSYCYVCCALEILLACCVII